MSNIAYTMDDQGFIQAAAEKSITLREAIEMYERSSDTAIAAVNLALAMEGKMNREEDAITKGIYKTQYDQNAKRAKHADDMTAILKAIIKYRWPGAAADLFS